MCELDETIMDMAIEENVFQFLHSSVVATDTFHKEEFYLRRVHGLVTDFLVNMPLKVSNRCSLLARNRFICRQFVCILSKPFECGNRRVAVL